MSRLLPKLYQEWALLDGAVMAGCSELQARKLRVGCLIVELEQRAARRGHG